jgi:pimeloyl-ACP methyl ester carboxylesterase
MIDSQIDIPGGQLNVWHRPSSDGAATVALIHGLTGTSRWWAPVISHLPEELGVTAIDIRGRGLSWQAPPPYGLAAVADDIRSALDHFEVDAVQVVAGYSMGAWVAALFARRNPDRAHRLVLVDGGLEFPAPRELPPAEAVEFAVGPAVERLRMTFASAESYLGFWKKHPAMAGTWHPLTPGALAYDIHRPVDIWVPRANLDAVKISGADMIVDPQATSATFETDVDATILIVDHGMNGQPGGFMSVESARNAANSNPSLHVSMLENLNHYSLMLGEGAPQVAASISAAVG